MSDRPMLLGPANMTAEEVDYQLALGASIAALLQPIALVLAVIQVGDEHGWDSCITEYRDMLSEADRLLTELGKLAGATQEIQRHNMAYLKAAEREPRH